MIGFPLLIIPFAIYNMIAFLTPMDWERPALFAFRAEVGLVWAPTLGDAFLVFSLLMLMFEFIKSARTASPSSSISCRCCWRAAPRPNSDGARRRGNSTFLLFVAICFVDLFAGFAASLRRARRRWWSSRRRSCVGARARAPSRSCRAGARRAGAVEPPMPSPGPSRRLRSTPSRTEPV